MRSRLFRPLGFIGLFVFFLLIDKAPAAPPPPEKVPPGATKKEIEIGNKSSAELEKDPKVKLLKDDTADNKALLAKVNGMAVELGKASARPLIKYQVKIIDDKDLNAFTLPNGRIYVFKGLLDFAGSDDEIAAVLAHEIGHNARMHALRGQAKAKNLSWAGLAAMVAMVAGGRSGADIGQFSQYLLMGVMNGYTEEYEKEADQAAIGELAKTKYNPSAMVTLMQRLAFEEQRHPDVQLGIFRTHPTSEERTQAAIAGIRALGLPFTPRAVEGATQATVVEDKDRVAVKYGDVSLIEFAPGKQPPGTKERAQKAADQINLLIRDNLQMHELTTDGNATSARLLGRGIEIARVTPEDAKLVNLTPIECAAKWRDNFRRIFWSEAINGKM